MTQNFTDYIGSQGANYIKDTVVAITGAASGFGRLTAYEVLKMGGKVVGLDREPVGLAETLAEGNKIAEGNIVVIEGDVGIYEDMQAMIKLGVDTFGRVDTFLANAGTMPLAPMSMHATALPKWQDCLQTNIMGPLHGMCATYDLFMEQGYGHFITISSIYGNFPVENGGIYNASKMAVRYLGSSLRTEAHGKIKVSNVSPTAVPGTNLSKCVLARAGNLGILGHFAAECVAKAQARIHSHTTGEYSPYTDQDSPMYASPTAAELVWAIMFVMNQPKGVNVGDITLRTTGESFAL